MEPQQPMSAEKAAAVREAAKQDRQIEADIDKELFKSLWKAATMP
jgi:hypothetical protein